MPFSPIPADVLAANEQLYRVAGINPRSVVIVKTSPRVSVMGSPIRLPTTTHDILYPAMIPLLSSSGGGAQENSTESGPRTLNVMLRGGLSGAAGKKDGRNTAMKGHS